MALIAWSICEQVSRACTARISSPGDPSSPGAFAAHSKSSHTPSRRALASSIRSIEEIEDVIGISVQSLGCCPRDNGSLSSVSFPAFSLFYLSIYLSACVFSHGHILRLVLFFGLSTYPFFFSLAFLLFRFSSPSLYFPIVFSVQSSFFLSVFLLFFFLFFRFSISLSFYLSVRLHVDLSAFPLVNSSNLSSFLLALAPLL